MIITEDVIAFKYCEQDSEYDDVIGLDDIVSYQDMSKLANSQNSRMWSQEGTSLSHSLLPFPQDEKDGSFTYARIVKSDKSEKE